MSYREHAPDPSLRDRIECYWTLERAGSPHRVLPDGCMDLIVSPGEGSARVIGVMTRAIVTEASSGGWCIGVRFRPGSTRDFVEAAPSELRDRTVDLGEFWGRSAGALVERISERREAATSILDEVLAARGAFRPSLVQRATALWSASAGGLAVREVARRLGVGERRLERAFLSRVGVGPKQYARVVRVQRAVALALRARGRASWTEIAHAAGYADQAHFIREFRELCGVTPGEWERERQLSDPFNSSGTGESTVRPSWPSNSSLPY